MIIIFHSSIVMFILTIGLQLSKPQRKHLLKLQGLKHDGPVGEKLVDSRVTKDITCRLGTPQSRSSKRHRVVFFLDDRKREIRVVTNLMMVSAELIADMYKARWKIESFFHWIKQNLNVSVLFGTTPNAVYNQLFAGLTAYVLLKWLYKNTKNKKVFHVLSFSGFQRKLLHNGLPIDWLSEIIVLLKENLAFHRVSLSYST